MLAQYANLTIDLSWVIFDQEIAPVECWTGGGPPDRRIPRRVL
jgi:hypothetical protein